MWFALVASIAAFFAISDRISRPVEPKRVEMGQMPPVAKKQATLTPGRVVELETAKGKIEFVLFEKDCPKTTKRIADLVEGGNYNGIEFSRVEKDFVIQIAEPKKKVKPMSCEVLKGLVHAKGAVGMARGNDFESNTSVFYITLEPAPHLDTQYTVFGRVIRGMDVALNIKIGDKIKRAKLREITAADKERFGEILKIESERKVDQ